MKKKVFVFIVFIMYLFFMIPNVYAAGEYESVSMKDGDYELVCTYNDGVKVTFSKEYVFLERYSIDQSSQSTNQSETFYLGEATNKYDSEGNVIEYNSYKLLTNYRCPKQLYPYAEFSETIEVGIDEDGDEITESIYNYYYTTKNNVKCETKNVYRCFCDDTMLADTKFYDAESSYAQNRGWETLYDAFDYSNGYIDFSWTAAATGYNAEIVAQVYCNKHYSGSCSGEIKASTISKEICDTYHFSKTAGKRDVVGLISEEAYLTTPKVTKICDYETEKESPTSTVQSASIYLYDNMAFIEMGGRITPAAGKYNDCPYMPAFDTDGKQLTEAPDIYINDPTPKTTAGNYSVLKYNAMRFNIYDTAESCEANNGNTECVSLKYIGSRYGKGNVSGSREVCYLLGNRTATLIRDIVSWLRILVPALVIVLIGLDITKMVLAGNLKEELPKKKKSIIIRLIVMLFFFFLPLFVVLIIKLINMSPDINIGDVSCLFLE